jgi:hypothetical protein
MRINIGRITYGNIGSTKSDRLIVVGKNAKSCTTLPRVQNHFYATQEKFVTLTLSKGNCPFMKYWESWLTYQIGSG